MGWDSRVVGLTVEPPADLLAHPANPRRHPARQREVMRAAFDAVGIAAPVIVNQRTQRVLDGHLRIEECISEDVAGVPVVWVDLGEEEEALFLATFDPIAALADYDRERLDDLLADIETGSAALDEMLADLTGTNVDGRPVTGPLAPELAGSDVKTLVLVLDPDQWSEFMSGLAGVPGSSTLAKLFFLIHRYTGDGVGD